MPYMMSRIVDVKAAFEAIPVNQEALMMPITMIFAVKMGFAVGTKVAMKYNMAVH